MPHVRGLKRCLPKATAALAIDEDASSRETFPEEAHALTRAVRDGLQRNAEATEAVVHAIDGGTCVSVEGDYVEASCSVDEDAIGRILQRVSSHACVKRPFERRSLVHSYHIDSLTYVVEHFHRSSGEKKIRCWDERCCELDVRPGLGAAVAFQKRDNVRPHLFPARSDLHHVERAERLVVDMTGNAYLQVDVLGNDVARACAVIKRTDYAFPYKAVCRTMACLLSGRAASG
jgi:hypothetical protein